MKRTSIIFTSVKRLIILGLAIIVIISLISGMQLYNRLSSEYKEVANSYIQMVSYEIEADTIKDMTNAQNHELIKNIDMSQYINGALDIPEETAKLCFDWYYNNYILYDNV